MIMTPNAAVKNPIPTHVIPAVHDLVIRLQEFDAHAQSVPQFLTLLLRIAPCFWSILDGTRALTLTGPRYRLTAAALPTAHSKNRLWPANACFGVLAMGKCQNWASTGYDRYGENVSISMATLNDC